MSHFPDPLSRSRYPILPLPTGGCIRAETTKLKVGATFYYAASEETTLTEEVNLAAVERDRYYAFATVLDILRIQEIDTGKVIREAVSHSDNIGYFVTDKYGSWRSVPE